MRRQQRRGVQPEARKDLAAQDEVTAIGGFWTQSRFGCMFMGMTDAIEIEITN